MAAKCSMKSICRCAFRERFGAAAPVSQYAASAYSAVRLFALALERAGEMDTQRMMACARGLEMEAPHGRVVIDAATTTPG